MADRKIRITVGKITADAVLNETRTAAAIWDALPLSIPGSTWGDEIYFGIPVKAKPEHPSEVVEKGDLAYWPPGSAFCIFYGPTPASRGDEIRAASPVTVFGRLLGDPTVFKPVRSGTTVRVERA
ncbi:MAG TPA: cyclophilin-like fold protein [Methylomirabilota bacterium]|nr:cyclophilin-like fold protein [Methylomirabilota bacterium]